MTSQTSEPLCYTKVGQFVFTLDFQDQAQKVWKFFLSTMKKDPAQNSNPNTCIKWAVGKVVEGSFKVKFTMKKFQTNEGKKLKQHASKSLKTIKWKVRRFILE